MLASSASATCWHTDCPRSSLRRTYCAILPSPAVKQFPPRKSGPRCKGCSAGRRMPIGARRADDGVRAPVIYPPSARYDRGSSSVMTKDPTPLHAEARVKGPWLHHAAFFLRPLSVPARRACRKRAAVPRSWLEVLKPHGSGPPVLRFRFLQAEAEWRLNVHRNSHGGCRPGFE